MPKTRSSKQNKAVQNKAETSTAKNDGDNMEISSNHFASGSDTEKTIRKPNSALSNAHQQPSKRSRTSGPQGNVTFGSGSVTSQLPLPPSSREFT